MLFLLLIALFFFIDFYLKNIIEITPNEKLPKSVLHGHIAEGNGFKQFGHLSLSNLYHKLINLQFLTTTS